MSSFDKEIVKMDKSNATVVGFKIDGRKIFTEYFEELVEEMCYHALAKEWCKGEIPDPEETFKFIEDQLRDILLQTTNKIAHIKMLRIISKDAREIKRELMLRCFGEETALDDENDNKESTAENEQ